MDVVWTVSPNLQKMNETTLSLTVRGRTGANGHAYVIAIVDGISYRQDIWIGEPQVTTTYQQTNPSLMYVYLMGENGTDLEKQGITNVDWQLTNLTGNCIPYLSTFGNNNFVKLVEANCNQWQAQLNITVTNQCGSVQMTRTVASDSYLGGGGGYPCFISINFFGQDVLVPCASFPPFWGLRHGINQFSIHDYMGVNYGIYQNTNILPSNLPLGLYLIKILDTEGRLFTLKYIKQ